MVSEGAVFEGHQDHVRIVTMDCKVDHLEGGSVRDLVETLLGSRVEGVFNCDSRWHGEGTAKHRNPEAVGNAFLRVVLITEANRVGTEPDHFAIGVEVGLQLVEDFRMLRRSQCV